MHHRSFIAVNVGDEGGFAPNISTIYEALGLIKQAIEGSSCGNKIAIALDAAASGTISLMSEFYDQSTGMYNLGKKTARANFVTGDQLLDIYLDVSSKYPSMPFLDRKVISIEDPFDQDDWEHWSKLTSAVSFQIVGDDLTVSNPSRIQLAHEKKACTALLLKVNQIGTLSESIEA